MSTVQWLPIIITGMLVQISIQIYYIKVCWDNKSLPSRQRAWWIAAIAVFNLPAAAVYLLVNRKGKSAFSETTDDSDYDPNIKQAVSLLLYLLYLIFSITILFNNAQRQDLTVFVSLITVGFVTIFISWFFNGEKLKIVHYILPVVSFAVASVINYMDDFSITNMIILVMAANTINNHSLRASRIYSVIGFILFFGAASAGLYKGGATVTADEFVGYMYLNVTIYILVFMAFYMLKKQLLLNVRMRELVEETNRKSRELEKMTVISERNKIAGEIHDNVGHTLTSAMITLDNAVKNVGKDDRGTINLITKARNQIKMGMDDIRYSVRAIKYGNTESDFKEALSEMIDELEAGTKLRINYIVEIKHDPIPIHRNHIFRVIKESVTNSLKHCDCGSVDVLVSESNDILSIVCSDDGEGTDSFREGFGLRNIREITEGLGGRAVFTSSRGEGFTISIGIPLGKERFDGE